MVYFHQTAKDLAFFDIRLKTHGHKNNIVVRGNDAEVASIPVEGHVKILTQEDLHVKRIRLQLVGELHLDYYERSGSGNMAGLVCERDCAVKVVWPNLLTSAEGNIVYGDYGDSVVKLLKVDAYSRKPLRDNSSLDLLSIGSNHSSGDSGTKKRPGFSRALSQPILFKNHEESLFQIPRSGIDGTPYPLLKGSESHSFLLPQGNYSMPFHINLPSNVPESVEGLSTGKVLYKLVCTMERGRFDRAFYRARHFRILRTLHPQSMSLTDSIEFLNTWPGKLDFNVSTPRKALAMGTTVPIKLVIVPLVKGLSFKSMSVTIVQHDHAKGLAGPSPEFEKLIGRQKLACEESEFTEDHWIVKGKYKVPSSLTELTPSCALKNDMISVKHRLLVGIHIKNADGHVSELKANLPVHIYMSPFHGYVTSRRLNVDAIHGNFIANTDSTKEDVIFDRRDTDLPEEGHPDDALDDENEIDEEQESAPPLYQQHVFDTVFDYTSAKSPMEQLRSSGNQSANGYFDIPRALSRSGTATPIDLNVLLKVPSYEQAVDDASDDDDDDEPAPLYPSGSQLDNLSAYVTSRLGERSASMSQLLSPDRFQHKLGSRLRFERKELPS